MTGGSPGRALPVDYDDDPERFAVNQAATAAYSSDPELAAVLPRWGEPGTFDAEDAAGIVSSVMTEVEVEHWDAPIVELPDRDAVALFLRGRGLSVAAAARRADGFTTPLRITKRGCLVRGNAPG